MKESKAQIAAQIRNEVAKNYNKRIEYLDGINKQLDTQVKESWKKQNQLSKENEELSEKIKQLEEWNARLLEFMDSEDPKAAFNEYMSEIKSSKLINDRLSTLSSLFTRSLFL